MEAYLVAVGVIALIYMLLAIGLNMQYGYTGLEGWVPAQLIGGWIDFRRLPNGAPLIAAWQIRAPIPLQSGQRRKLYGFKEREGRVINVFTADGHPVTLPN